MKSDTSSNGSNESEQTNETMIMFLYFPSYVYSSFWSDKQWRFML